MGNHIDPLPKEVRDRIKAARARGGLRAYKYVIENDVGMVSEVLCKACGEVIRDLRPVAEPLEDDTVPVALISLAHYTEVKIEFDDGSFHITPMCGDCAKAGWTSEALEELYGSDLDQWALDAFDAAEILRWARRKPVKIVASSRRPEDLYE